MWYRVLSLALLVIVPHSLFAQTKPPAVPPATPVDPKAVPPDLADWTPRPATGKAEPWEKATDVDWVDARFRSMDTGPFLNATFQYPNGPEKVTVYKGTAVRLGTPGRASLIFDRNTLRVVTTWKDKYLNHSDRRFGLLNTPTPAGEQWLYSPSGPGWADPEGQWDAKGKGVTAPLPASWAKYRGLYVHGDRVVFEYTVGDRRVLETAVMVVALDRRPGVTRVVTVGPGTKPIQWKPNGSDKTPTIFEASKNSSTRIVAAGGPVHLEAEPPEKFTKPGPARWGKPLVTKLVRGNDNGPFAIDTLTIPYDNPHKALFFCTGLDHMPDGRIAMCTCHGDVWLVKVDEKENTVAWQRYATGLYHPLGLKVLDGKVVVLERGQLTKLHDNNDDDEADFYECLANDWDTGAGEHSYDTCLETDPEGNFYFFKTGDTHLPTGGCLIKVSKDGSKTEIFATGFRHPIGMGMSSTGVLTGADQEGNWMPATRIDEYKKGGFYGDMRGHHRATPPSTYDPPLLWLPREVDNSAGGQVWVPEKTFGPLGGLPLHLSYGRCKAFVLLRQTYEGGVQGGVWDLGWKFLSGSCRGRFGPDGNLYVCGLNGWQTAAQADGSLQRVRATGKPVNVPVRMEVVPDGVRFTFSQPLDKASVEDVKNYRAAWWDYKWSGDYGSYRYKPSGIGVIGQDDVSVTKASLLADGKTVHVSVGKMQPVMQMQVGLNVKTADGATVVGSVFLTVHSVGK